MNLSGATQEEGESRCKTQKRKGCGGAGRWQPRKHYFPDNGDDSHSNDNADAEGREFAAACKTSADDDNVDLKDKLFGDGIDNDDINEEDNHVEASMTRNGCTGCAAVRRADRNANVVVT